MFGLFYLLLCLAIADNVLLILNCVGVAERLLV